MKYRVPFVNYPLQYKKLKREIDKTINKVLLGGDLILRKDIQEFEKRLAKFVGTKYAVALNSGTDALFLSLKAAGIGKGEEVITVSHTFVATLAAVVHSGAVPILVDVGDDFLMEVDKVEKVITKRTRAIMPVHFNGRICQMEKLMAIAKKHNLIVIEDAAQALGAFFKGKKAGSFGLTGCFSFYPAKILGCLGDGGAITTNDKRIAEKIRLLRDHGQKTPNQSKPSTRAKHGAGLVPNRVAFGDSGSGHGTGKVKTSIVCYGWNSRLDNLQAAVLNVKLKYLTKWIKRRREIAKIYNKGLAGIPELKTPPGLDSGSLHFDVYQNYILRVKKRNKLFEHLKKKGVETLIKDPIPNHLQRGLGLSRFRLPNSERLSKEVISLPMYPELTNNQIKYVIKSVRSFYAQ